ncbi:C-X-C chemokine receptor type 1 [Boleophthalmus pectinirostris]|uniref:C-X-C chemokine receptor type 1 n=1 Tax=Boleophthalmus pectinirostris TaxID=150288 RepID=UPI000A1C5ABB|nr:C-X-C chemokine receptor type 1 [Boleophthalmus pectinirostris]
MKTFIFLTFLSLALSEEYEDATGFSFDGFTFTDTMWTGEGKAALCDFNPPGFRTLGIKLTYIVVFIFSFLGNSLVVFVVSCMKKVRASTDIYLMHLAIADLLFCLTLPFWAVYIHSGWVFGNVLCKILSGFQEASVYSGVFLLVCISIDRYFAIVRAKRSLSSHNVAVKVICGVVWVIAVMLALPFAIQRQSMFMDNEIGYICFENFTGESMSHWRVTVHVLRHTMGFFIPFVIMSVCYGCTIVKLLHSRNQKKHKAMRVILAVVLAFILCWLPFNVSVLIDTLIRGGSLPVETCETQYMVEKMLNVTQVFAFAHCMINPILYAFIGEKFRNQLLSALYKHGVISKRIHQAYRKGSVNSTGSLRSRNTSVTM